MTEFDYLPAVAFVLSFISISLVLVQLNDQMKQRKIDSQIRIDDINRQLITLGFSHPELFKVLHGEEADPIVERHYLQLWFNQFYLIYSYQTRGLFAQDRRESLERDIRDFFAQENMQRHWRHHRVYYPFSFQSFVDALAPSAAKDGPSR